MALVRCPDCGSQVSSSAPACVKCGRPLTDEDRDVTRGGCGSLVFTMIVLAGLGYWIWHQVNEPPAPAPRPSQQAAPSPEDLARREVLARAIVGAKSIKAAMRDPESFDLEQVLMIEKTGAICYTYRAKNGFGGFNRELAVLRKGESALRSSGTSGFESVWNKSCANKTGQDLTREVSVFV